MSVDFGKTASDYARHRVGFPDRFFDRLFKGGVAAKGERVLDLGTGTGTIARGLAKRGCLVAALDPSEPLLEQAKSLDRDAGVAVDYIRARVEQTGLPDAQFDIVIAGQCWHWFDRPQAAHEARRLLAPFGRLVIAHFDWLPLPGNAVEATEALIRAHNPAWMLHGGTGLYPAWFADLSQAGFVDVESFSLDVSVAYSHEGWPGRIRASAGITASLPSEAVERFNSSTSRIACAAFS